MPDDRGNAGLAPLTVLIVDDEQPARRRLRRMVDAAPGIAKVFEAGTARLALDVIAQEEPDVVFLDVRMPGMDGFQLVEQLGERAGTDIIFVTAYDEHALRAFGVHAIDYLLKPYDETRFRAALERAREATAGRRALAGAHRDADAVLQAFRDAVPGTRLTRLLVDAAPGTRVLLPLDRVQRIEADRNDAVLLADGRTYRLRSTLGDLEARLDPDRFIRINRSEIVNLDQVTAVEPLDHGDARIHMRDGAVRRMSRRYRDRIRRFE